MSLRVPTGRSWPIRLWMKGQGGALTTSWPGLAAIIATSLQGRGRYQQATTTEAILTDSTAALSETGITDHTLRDIPDTRRPRRSETSMVAFFCGGLYLVIVGLGALFLPFPNNFDELAHLSYAAAVAQHDLARVDLFGLRMLPATLAPGFTAAPNYLNHPPAYYLLLSLFFPPNGWPTMETVSVLRLLNVLLSASAIGCALAAGMLRGYERRLLFLYGLMVIFVPVLWCIGGAINNDNLGYLGGCLCVLGAQILQSNDDERRGGWLLIAGCSLAMLTKLTAGIMAGTFTASFLGLRWYAHRQPPTMRFLAVWVACVGIACLPYLCFLLEYGSPAPITPGFRSAYQHIATLFGTYDLHLHGWQSGNHLGLPAYAIQFAIWLLADWNPVLRMTAPLNAAILLVPASLLALAGFAWLCNWRPGRTQDHLIAAGAVALAIVVPLHVAFSYAMYREVGSPPFDAVPRYYFPLSLAVVPLSACWTLARLRRPLASMLGWILALAVVLAPFAIITDSGRLLHG